MSQKADGRPNLPQKTREEIKAEREAKKVAKAAAKVAKINSSKAAGKNVASVATCKVPDAKVLVVTEKINKVVEADDIKSKCVAADSEILKEDKKATIDAAGSQPKALKEKTIQSSNVAWNGASDGTNEGKSKAELRAERRVKQEAQRAAKQQQQQSLPKDSVKKSEEFLKPRVETISENSVKKGVAKSAKEREDEHEVHLFKHLYQERHKSLMSIATVNSSIHPAIVKLGVQYAAKIIVGSNARCVALLAAVKQVVQDFEKPAQADFSRGLEASFKESLKYLHHCRPLGVSMQNAMHHIQRQMTQFSTTMSDKAVSDFVFAMYLYCYN